MTPVSLNLPSIREIHELCENYVKQVQKEQKNTASKAFMDTGGTEEEMESPQN